MLLKLGEGCCTLRNILDDTHFDVAMVTCSVPVSFLLKIKYYHTQDCRNNARNKYIKDFARDDCARNMSEEKSAMSRGIICAKILPLHVHSPSLPELPPGLSPQSNGTHYLVNSQLQKTHDLDELLTGACDMVT